LNLYNITCIIYYIFFYGITFILQLFMYKFTKFQLFPLPQSWNLPKQVLFNLVFRLNGCVLWEAIVQKLTRLKWPNQMQAKSWRPIMHQLCYVRFKKLSSAFWFVDFCKKSLPLKFEAEIWKHRTNCHWFWPNFRVMNCRCYLKVQQLAY
jgi:hypothetical protein